MTLSEEMARFKAQYTSAEWERLMQTNFEACWNAKDLITCGEVANKVLHGDLSYSAHRLRTLAKDWEF